MMMRMDSKFYDFISSESQKRGNSIYYFTNLIMELGQKAYQSKNKRKRTKQIENDNEDLQ